jgi:guanylate kinase
VPLVFVISAPSGSGKSTLVERLMERVPDLQFSISVTTRAPRTGEDPGESYDFVSRDDFLAMRDRDELLEWAEVFGNFYGTSRRVLERAGERGRDLILDIDVQGAAQLKEKLPAAVMIFILPPSRQELEHRLRHRSSDSADVIERRLDGAGREVSNYEFYDYVLVNDDLDESFEKLRGIILAERCRTSQMAGRIQPILESFRASTTT